MTSLPSTHTETWVPEGSEEFVYHEHPGDALVAPEAQVRRSILIPICFLFPVILSGISYALGGVPFLTDAAFILVTAICTILLMIELLDFHRRQGIGAILIYGGILIWFCHDYMGQWMGYDYNLSGAALGISGSVVCRAAFYHCVFFLFMVIAFRWPLFRWVDRMVVRVPEPRSDRFYLVILILVSMIGFSALLLTKDGFFSSFIKAPLWFWLDAPEYTVGRTGNMNYNWGGYLAQVLQIGQMSGILGAFYAILIARTILGKSLGISVWLYWLLYSISWERRGEIAFMGLPVVGLLFIKYNGLTLSNLRRSKARAYLITGAIAFAVLYLVAWETKDRYGWEKVDVTRVGGNSMFSEGLPAWALIPEFRGFANVTFPGADFIRPIPDTLFWFVINPIPRALWRNKPVDSYNVWYNSLVSEDTRSVDTGGVVGTTVSNGAVAAWYFRYGPAGVVEGALIYGWLMGVAERALRRAGGRPMGLLFALAFATFMFRCYRDLWWHNLYPIMIAGVVLWGLIKVTDIFTPQAAQTS
jgi:hypothetical protein